MLIKSTCLKCGKTTFMKVSKEQKDEWRNYVCYGGKTQDKLKSFDKFGRQFVKTGYCAECQKKFFGAEIDDPGRFFHADELRQDVMKEFHEKTKHMSPIQAIHSEDADMLSDNEKLVYKFYWGVKE